MEAKKQYYSLLTIALSNGDKNPGGGGVNDLWMDEVLPPGFQKATLFQLTTVAVTPTLMMNFGRELPIFYNFC